MGHNKIYATFENGHTVGIGIFQYDVSDEGVISWKVIYTNSF